MAECVFAGPSCVNCGRVSTSASVSCPGAAPLPPPRERANYLPAPHMFNLSMACMVVAQAFDFGVYLVGSSLERRDYRDVDVRAIVDDAEWARLFPDTEPHAGSLNPLWSVMCAAISLYLSQHSGLPVDFQIQQQTFANEKFRARRHALGIMVGRST